MEKSVAKCAFATLYTMAGQTADKFSGCCMGTVFSALVILWIALTLFRAAVTAPTGNKKKKAPSIVLEDTPPAEAVTPIIVTNNDDAIVAAITAAVAATLAEENGGTVPGFRVVSFRRANQNK